MIGEYISLLSTISHTHIHTLIRVNLFNYCLTLILDRRYGMTERAVTYDGVR